MAYHYSLYIVITRVDFRIGHRVQRVQTVFDGKCLGPWTSIYYLSKQSSYSLYSWSDILLLHHSFHIQPTKGQLPSAWNLHGDNQSHWSNKMNCWSSQWRFLGSKWLLTVDRCDIMHGLRLPLHLIITISASNTNWKMIQHPMWCLVSEATTP